MLELEKEKNSKKIVIRKVKPEDYDFVLELNKVNVEVLSPMDMERIEYFVKKSEVFFVAEVDGEKAAFLIGIREGVNSYESENYVWFSKNYKKFLYIDRVVIDEKYRKHGLGSKLYEEVFEKAKVDGIPYVTAEIDTIPYNKISLNFHEKLGFKEVGTQFVRNNKIKVSLQERAIDF